MARCRLLAALVVLPLLMSYGVMPLLLDDLGNYSNIRRTSF